MKADATLLNPDRTFVTYKDAQRLSLNANIQVMILYILSTERLLELARAYMQELEYIPTLL